MGRPRLPLRTAGAIRTYPVTKTVNGKERVTGYRAVCKFRDSDGKVRPIERCGNTKNSAIGELKKAVRDRRAPSRRSGEITTDTRLSVVGEIYLKKIQADVSAGVKSPGTYDTYEYTYNNHVREELGELTVTEAKVWVLDEHLEFVREDVSVATAKLTRTVLSGMLNIAIKHGALERNPVRDCSRIEGGRRRAKPRALTTEERDRWRAQLLADEEAVKRDLPDICDGQMATGARIGEQLAVFWPDVDWERNEIAINWTVIRVRGKGLRRKSTKSMCGDRRVKVPRWYMTRLKARYQRTLDRSGPVYPNPSTGQGLRDPANTRRDLRNARGSAEFTWVTSHVFRKTAAKAMKEAGVPVRDIADQLGQGDIRVTQAHYLERGIVTTPQAAAALESLAPY